MSEMLTDVEWIWLPTAFVHVCQTVFNILLEYAYFIWDLPIALWTDKSQVRHYLNKMQLILQLFICKAFPNKMYACINS